MKEVFWFSILSVLVHISVVTARPKPEIWQRFPESDNSDLESEETLAGYKRSGWNSWSWGPAGGKRGGWNSWGWGPAGGKRSGWNSWGWGPAGKRSMPESGQGRYDGADATAKEEAQICDWWKRVLLDQKTADMNDLKVVYNVCSGHGGGVLN